MEITEADIIVFTIDASMKQTLKLMMEEYYEKCVHDRLFKQTTNLSNITENARRNEELCAEFVTTSVYLQLHIDAGKLPEYIELFVLLNTIPEETLVRLAGKVSLACVCTVLPIAGNIITYCLENPKITSALIAASVAGKGLIDEFGFCECFRHGAAIAVTSAVQTQAAIGWCAWAMKGVGSLYLRNVTV